MAKVKRRRKGAALVALILCAATLLATQTHNALLVGVFEMPASIAILVALVGRSPKQTVRGNRSQARATGDDTYYDEEREYTPGKSWGQTFSDARREDDQAHEDMMNDYQRGQEDNGQV